MSTTDAEFRTASKEAAQSTHMQAALRLAEIVANPETKIEEIIKIYNSTKDVAGAVPEKKIDPNAGLRTFNITMVNGAINATVQIQEPVEENILEMEPVSAAFSIEDLPVLTTEIIEMKPSKLMRANRKINADLSGLKVGVRA